MSDLSDLIGGGGGGSALEATASGTLADGSKVVINSDGTVSKIFEQTAALGTLGSFTTDNAMTLSAAYHEVEQKIVIVYENQSNGNCKAAVGSISGTTITFATPVTISSNTTYSTAIVYDPVQNKMVIAYADGGNNNRGTAVVATVSGTTITLGTPVAFTTSSLYAPNTSAPTRLDAIYYATEQKVVINHILASNTNGGSIVGTVSGTSISFGTAVYFETGQCVQHSSSYNAAADKMFISYLSTSNYGKAIIGTVSGSVISFGTPLTLYSSSSDYIINTYHAAAQRNFVHYRPASGSGSTQSIYSVSGSTITGLNSTSGPTNTQYAGLTYSANGEQVVFAYQNGNDSSRAYYDSYRIVNDVITAVTSSQLSTETSALYLTPIYDPSSGNTLINFKTSTNPNGRSIVAQLEIPTNLTTENYIGISDGAYADGATANVQIVGSVDDAQSGLTAGQSYYVQEDGTIGTTPDTTSVFAGTAVSATKLIVKG